MHRVLPAFLVVAWSAIVVGADQPVIIVPPGSTVFGGNAPVTTQCWTDIHYFDSLRTGPIEYCRRHLRFQPGAADCLQIVDRVCTVWYPDRGEWGETRLSGEPRLIRCPRGDEPPVCPQFNPGRQRGGSWR